MVILVCVVREGLEVGTFELRSKRQEGVGSGKTEGKSILTKVSLKSGDLVANSLT